MCRSHDQLISTVRGYLLERVLDGCENARGVNVERERILAAFHSIELQFVAFEGTFDRSEVCRLREQIHPKLEDVKNC